MECKGNQDTYEGLQEPSIFLAWFALAPSNLADNSLDFLYYALGSPHLLAGVCD